MWKKGLKQNALLLKNANAKLVFCFLFFIIITFLTFFFSVASWTNFPFFSKNWKKKKKKNRWASKKPISKAKRVIFWDKLVFLFGLIVNSVAKPIKNQIYVYFIHFLFFFFSIKIHILGNFCTENFTSKFTAPFGKFHAPGAFITNNTVPLLQKYLTMHIFIDW